MYIIFDQNVCPPYVNAGCVPVYMKGADVPRTAGGRAPHRGTSATAA